MDNLTHVLVGFALGEAGLKRITPLGAATLIIGANLPDLDAISLLSANPVEAFVARRGLTHGIVAIVILPVLLAGSMLLWDRIVRRRTAVADEPARFRGLLLLAILGVWSHILLDLASTSGVRLLMPFSDRWFYGDTLFIVDPLVWGALIVGVLLSSRRWNRGTLDPGVPARVALAGVAVYAAAMGVSSYAGRLIVERHAVTGPAQHTMISPVLLSPFRRTTVRDLGTWYEVGRLDWLPRPVYRVEQIMRDGRDSPEARVAAYSPAGQAFLAWARFPIFDVGVGRRPNRVMIRDLRYARTPGQGWATVSIPVPHGVSGGFDQR